MDGNVTGANLEIVGDTLNLGSSSLSLAGNLTQTGGTINGGTSTLAFNGSTTQNLTLNTATTFNHLTIASGTTLVETAANDYATVGGILTNNGIIRKSQNVTTTGNKTFGLTNARINVTTRGILSHVQVDRADVNHPNANVYTGTGRFWTLVATGSGYTVDLTLPHNLTNQALAQVCRYAGSTWDCARTSSTANTVTRSGFMQMSDWAVGNLTSLYLPLILK
ncbi:MAG: hypothetical protein HZB51_11570 [Chloroflexi bacterium]|nr:hypothetical protein [Chloroflexota bacterium]